MDELIEVMARAAFERRHKGARNCYAWGDFWEENEYQRKHYMNEAQAALAAIKANGFAVVRGWQDIASAPHACHVLAARYMDDCGDWAMGVVVSPPSYPFTHWMPPPDAPLTAPLP
jgi:hypothetical protein